MRSLPAALLALVVCLAAPARADTILVFAAASLREALDAAARSFERETGHRVSLSYAASSALARQVEGGAPAGIFVSADTDWIDHVEARGLAVAGSRVNIAANDLVLVAPAGSGLKLRLAPGVDVAAALGTRRIALANPDAVPAGKYARAAFTALGAWSSIRDKVAATDNVRAALALVARGETPLGVVYRTDAIAEPGVRIVDAFPPTSHPPIVYPAVRLRRADTPATRELHAYLSTAAARAIFSRFGFRAP